MEDLPEEIIAQIFSYLTDGHSAIAASQVCTYFKTVATTQLREINMKISNEKQDEIIFAQEGLAEFKAMKKLKLEISFDVNNVDKAKFCERFCDKLTHLCLSEMTFLNPFFENQDISFSNLETLAIVNSDLTSCSEEISTFILRCCPVLKNLRLIGCSGLEIDSLNYIGQNLSQTTIENFQLLPTYSYFDVSQSSACHWTIENLTTLSVRSKLVVMKKNFVRNLIGQRNDRLKTLELIAELDLGEALVPRIIQNYPNLEKLSIGKGCSIVRNEDFFNCCNFYKNLKSFEFHFSQVDDDVDLRGLTRNESINELTIGLTKNINAINLKDIAKCLPNVTRLSIILYYPATSHQEFLAFIMKIFPGVQHLEFQRVGMSENMKFTAIKEEIDLATHDIRNLVQ